MLGNYSVTLIDSLSTLAILASDPDADKRKEALLDFQSGIKSLVDLYGDGTEEGRCGTRACGFDLDSKVQVFETNIRGLGGLLSAHLFAMGDLPINGYHPKEMAGKDGTSVIDWNGWSYDGQLLRLAHDLGSRLLPAFSTSTGLPYPRVNLRTGIPFYRDAEQGVCRVDGTSSSAREITETCTAGAGSLVLEFTTLSRLTGDDRFENLAKRAFWAVWQRRSSIGLLAGGIDAETGQWISPPLAGIGAGIDSFFEYAMKSYILISGLAPSPTAELDDPDDFLLAWQEAHGAVKRHIYRAASSQKYAFYAQADLITGAPRYSWIDNLSAYYPGLLTLAGELDEAIESHLLYAALWTKYSALPERIHILNGHIDPNFRHWAGRPEFIESTYYIYQATRDPWYLHVGEMALRDIRRRCWASCGWADLVDVVSGEQRDRMESFFLGETAKYLYLLFTPKHPLNSIDAPVVFTTEGHPLVIPVSYRKRQGRERATDIERNSLIDTATCPIPAKPIPFTISNTANRSDIFHASALAQLHTTRIHPAHQHSSPILPSSPSGPGVSINDIRSPSNYTFYPWTLPQSLIPVTGWSKAIYSPVMSTLSFPNLHAEGVGNGGIGSEKSLIPLGALQKVMNGIIVNSLSNIRFNMVQEPKSMLLPDAGSDLVEFDEDFQYRIHGIANWALGKDEKVMLSPQALGSVGPGDPHFTRVKDLEMMDLVVHLPFLGPTSGTQGALYVTDVTDTAYNEQTTEHTAMSVAEIEDASLDTEGLWDDIEALLASILSSAKSSLTGTVPHMTAAPDPEVKNEDLGRSQRAPILRYTIPAILPAGPGAALLPSELEADDLLHQLPVQGHTMFYLEDELCNFRLPVDLLKLYNVVVILRGGCSFSEKLANIPAIPAPAGGRTLGSLMVIVVDTTEPNLDGDRTSSASSTPKRRSLIRPLLDRTQLTPGGIERREGIGMCMIDGSVIIPPIHDPASSIVPAQLTAAEVLRSAAAGVGRLDAGGNLVQELKDRKEDATSAGLGVKRRFWFESLGVPIGNLIML